MTGKCMTSSNQSLKGFCPFDLKEKKRKIFIMGSKKAELYQISVGQKRKNLDARAFKALFKRQRIKEDLPGCSITENTSTSGSADCMVGPQGVDPAIGELTELQGTQVAASKEGHPTITDTNLAESLQMDSISTDDAISSMSGRRTFGAEVGTGGLEERFLLLSEQNNRHNFLRVELGRLCQILKFSEDGTHRVREFLEYVIQNHDLSSDTPAIMHAFQLSVCWIATLIDKQKVDTKEYFNLAKKHLNYQCTEEQVYSIYSKMLPLKLTYLQSSENTSDSGKDCMLTDEESSKEPSHIIDGTPLFSLSKEKKAKVEIEERVETILKQKLGMNVKAAGSEIHDKIKKIRKKCEKQMKKLDRKQEEEVHGLLRTWEKEKIKLEKDNKLESAVIRLIYGQGLVQTSKLKILDDKFAKKMEEHNLLKNMQLNSLKEKQLAARNEACQKAADWLDEAIACAIKLGTVNGPQPFGFQSENGPEQITDEIRPVEMYEEGGTELTRPVSDDIVLHGDPVESKNTSNIGDSIDLPNTEVNHRSEPCQSSNGSLSFPGQALVHSEEVSAFPDHGGLLKQHVSQNEIHQVASAELDDQDTPSAEIQSTSQVEVATSELGDTVTLVQPNHAVPVTENKNRDQGTNFSPTVVAGEREDFSDEFIFHHNRLDLGQASRICHEQNVEFVRSPDNTVMSEVTSTTELPNQSAPQLGIDADHFHGPINNDAEITSSTCVCESQNEIHQVVSAEPEKLDTPAVEIKNTSETEVASGAVTLVQSNHAVPVTGNYKQLHHLSVDASLICNQSSPDGIDHQNSDRVTNFSQTVEAGETEEFSHEFVSQSSENLHHNHLYMGQASRISREQSVEVFVCSQDNTVMAQAVSTTEAPNQSVPQLGIDAGHLRGPSHLLPTHPVTCWNSTPSLVAEPLQNELEKLLKEAEQMEKMYRDAVSQLKSACDKEIQEIINQIRTKYDKKLQDAEANFRLKKNELEKSKNLVLMNTKLAKAFRSKFHFRPLQLQQVFTSSLEQHLHQRSLPPSMRIFPLESASQLLPSQQTLAPSAEALNQLHMLPPVRSSPVAIRNATASPPMQAIQRAGSVLSGNSARPLVIASHTPAAYPGIAEIRSRAPHLQPFRLAAAPSMAPSSFSVIPQRHPQPVLPPQLVATTLPAPRPPRLPQVMPNRLSQNAPEPRSRQQFHLNQSQSPIDLPRDMNHHVLMNHNLPPLADVDSKVRLLEPSNLVTPSNIQGNPPSSAVDTDIVCLSSEE